MDMMGMSSFWWELDVVVDVLFDQGVFVPVEVEVFDGAADAHGVFVLVCPHGVEHELHVVADGFADCFADFDVEHGVAVRVNLVCGPAHVLEAEGFFDVLSGGLPIGGGGIDGDGFFAGA